MPTIETGPVVTHINVFTVPPERQQALVDGLVESVEAASTVPEWRSASIHRSFDGRQVVNYVQFDSHEAAQARTHHLLATGHIQKNTSMGDVSPGQYEVVITLDRK